MDVEELSVVFVASKNSGGVKMIHIEGWNQQSACLMKKMFDLANLKNCKFGKNFSPISIFSSWFL